MKKVIALALLCAVGFNAFSQSKNNTLLWRISGNGLSKPSYIFGTIHMICADDIMISDSLTNAIKNTDEVYLELDLDNLFEMMQAMTKMRMRDDTTLSDLLTKDEYEKVKKFFSEKSSLLPFAILETYKPMLAASTLMQASINCANTVAMDQLVMQVAKQNGKPIYGLETMAYQMSIFDSIPYGIQAKQLFDMVDNFGKKTKDDDEMENLTKAYRNQQLEKLETITQSEDYGMKDFANIMLYNRNKNWVQKLDKLFKKNSLTIAVGAGHLPGEKGVINLLRKAGYKVEPVENKMIKKMTKEI